MQKSSSECW